MSNDSPLARSDTSRRLIKPHNISYINDICSVLVEERERLEREILSSPGNLDPSLIVGMICAVNRLVGVESRIAKLMQEWNKQTTENDE